MNTKAECPYCNGEIDAAGIHTPSVCAGLEARKHQQMISKMRRAIDRSRGVTVTCDGVEFPYGYDTHLHEVIMDEVADRAVDWTTEDLISLADEIILRATGVCRQCGAYDDHFEDCPNRSVCRELRHYACPICKGGCRASRPNPVCPDCGVAMKPE